MIPGDLATIAFEQAEGATVATVEGEIDMSNADTLLEDVLARVGEAPWLIIDFSGCSYLDSAGLGAIARIDDRCRRGGVGLSLVIPEAAAAVDRVITMTRMDELIPVARTLPDALAHAAGDERSP